MMSENSKVFSLDYLDYPNIPSAGLISKIFSGDKMGMVIRNFLNNEDLNEVNIYLKRAVKLDEVVTNRTFPDSFNSNEDYNADLSYLEGASNPVRIKIIERVLNTISVLEDNKQTGMVDDFLPGTFRIISPSHCHIDLHCGNQFFNRFKSAYKELSDRVNVNDQLSFFTVIKKPEKGGELSIFNAKWADYSDCNLKEQSLISRTENKIQSVEELEVYHPIINPGDLLIFQGGQYWHKVKEVYGKEQRITFGGFIGKNKSDDSIVIWS